MSVRNFFTVDTNVEDEACEKYDRLLKPMTTFDLDQKRTNGFNLESGRFTTLRVVKKGSLISLVARRHKDGKEISIPALKLPHFLISFPIESMVSD